MFSALPPKADVVDALWHFRLVPIGDMRGISSHQPGWHITSELLRRSLHQPALVFGKPDRHPQPPPAMRNRQVSASMSWSTRSQRSSQQPTTSKKMKSPDPSLIADFCNKICQ
jgi:hypothetical protein